MKKQFGVFATALFASVCLAQPQDASSPGESAIPESSDQETVQEGEILIIEPSGADTGNEIPTDPTTTGEVGQQEPETTVTVSQTFTNQANSITVIGTVDRAEDKQSVEESLKQALPGKEINNQLKVAAQEDSAITEPAGAERPERSEEELQRESELEESTPDEQFDEREFEVEGQSQP